MGKLGIYARQSREKETSGSIDDQVLQGKQQAEQLGFSYTVYIDRGESAAYDTLDNRPEFMRMINDIEDGLLTAVYVYDESRLTRNQTTKLYIKKKFAEYKIKVYTKIDGTIDFEDSDDEFMSDIRTLFASKFIKDSSKKIKGVLRGNAIKGRAHGGLMKPLGYTSDSNKMLVVDEEEAEIVKLIYSLCLSGKGSGKIASILNERNIPTKGSKVLKDGIHVTNKFTKERRHIPSSKLTWAGNTVLSILKNSIYKGERIHKGEIFPAPMIIDSETWCRVQKKNRR